MATLKDLPASNLLSHTGMDSKLVARVLTYRFWHADLHKSRVEATQ